MIVDRLRFVVFAALWTSLGALVAVPPPLVPSLMHLRMVSSSSSESHSLSSSSTSSLERVDQHVPTHLELMEKLDSRYTETTKKSGRNRIRTFFYARQASKNPCSWVQIEQVLSFLEKSTCCCPEGLDVFQFTSSIAQPLVSPFFPLLSLFNLSLAFPQDDESVLTILQSSPRILGKNVNNHLLPTAEFLKDFYGPTLFREVRLISKQRSRNHVCVCVCMCVCVHGLHLLL